MRTKELVLLVDIILMVASLGCVNKEEKQPQSTPAPEETKTIQISENVSTTIQQNNRLPDSVGQYYQKDPVYLFKMWELGGAMMGIVANFQQNDTENVKKSFDALSKSYSDSASMVPEWSEYYDTEAVSKLGNALESGNPHEVSPLMNKVGATCENCHKNNKPMVWAVYHWKDFRTINMTTINPEEPELPWIAAKMKYMAPAFDGTIANIKEKQQKNATDSWSQFNAMFSNMEKTCFNCHKEAPRSFVSQDVKSLINSAGKQIASGDLDVAGNTMQQIGDSCYRCHVIHEPAQRLRESLGK